ncbi:hypothetical protein FRC12_010940 [Ceratobasidium sp. 428]|nr:hypothetical protein FRC12_010940 [Ceratobasidium sp. 428]
MPHPLRSTAGSRLVYSVPVIVFMDDASGNVSKQSNKHWSSYLSNAALPREELQSEYNVRFVSTSAHASPSELMQGIRASMEEAFNSPAVAFDCVLQEEVLVRPYALFWAGDNPMQAEHCSSTGMNSNHFCRTCDAGGSDDFKQSFDGYKSLFESGNRRVASETQRVIDERLEMALLPKTINKCKNHARDTGVKDSMAQSTIDRLLDLGKLLRKSKKGVPRRSPLEIDSILRKELDSVRGGHYINPLLSMPGVDIHRDTPTEILHTVLLGVVKYYWGQSVFVLDKAKKILVLECRLASANTAGLNLPKLSASYMCQYRGSLIGKHFKAIVQLMPFLCYDILPAGILTAWLLLGRLTSLLWYIEIRDTPLYLQELQSVIDDFLLATAEGSPSIIILKPKFHFLIHLPSYIKRFGPALLFSTERFESFNGVFRAASTFSNRHAPSRDIGKRFADLDRVKHISSGGYWQEDNQWVRASDTLLNFISTNKVFGKLIGMPDKKTTTPGSVTLLPKTSTTSQIRSTPLSWNLFAADKTVFGDCQPIRGGNRYFHILSTVSQSGDSIEVGADILTTDDCFARVKAIYGCVLGTNNQYEYFVALRVFTLGDAKHTLLDLPILTRDETVVCASVKNILCAVNLQHNCAKKQTCNNMRAIHRVQEREQTSNVRYEVQHSDNDNFVLNLHTCHNAQTIRNALPAHLYSRCALFPNRDEVFQSAVGKLNVAKLKKERLNAAKKQVNDTMAEALREVMEGEAEEDEGEETIEAEIAEVLRPKRGKKRKAGGSGRRATQSSKKSKRPRQNL